MSTHPLDRTFRKGLKGKSATVPAGLWDSIQRQLPATNPPRKLLPFWLVGSALVLAMLATFLLWPDSEIRDNIESTTPEDPNIEQVLPLTPDSEVLNEQMDSELGVENVVPLTSIVENSDVAVTDLAGTEAATQKRSLISTPDYPIGETPTSKIVPSEPSDEILENSSQQHLPGNTQMAVIENEGTKLAVSVSLNSTEEILEKDESRQAHAVFDIAPIRLLGTEVEYKSELGLKVTDCYAFGKESAGRFLLEIYTGPAFSLRNLSSRNEDVGDYIAGRDSTESYQLSWLGGLRVGYEHASGLTARTGIQYTLVNEVFRQESRTSRTTIDSVFDSNNDLIRVDTIFETGTRIKQTQNRYHAVDIPLLIGYRIDNGNWDVGIQAGPVFNILFKSKGDMIDPASNEVGSFSDTSDPAYHPVFKDRLGISIYGAVYASKRIGNNLWAFVEPNLLYRLKSITLDSYPVEQKQANIGLSFGLRLKL
jgi:hypothetical protein